MPKRFEKRLQVLGRSQIDRLQRHTPPSGIADSHRSFANSITRWRGNWARASRALVRPVFKPKIEAFNSTVPFVALFKDPLGIRTDTGLYQREATATTGCTHTPPGAPTYGAAVKVIEGISVFL